MSMRPIYFDYSATTPVDPRVVDKMVPWLYERAGNPASRSHAYGWEAEEAVERARAQVASLVNADPREPRTDQIGGELLRDGRVDTAWGLHLIDMNISMGDLVDTVARLGRGWRGPPMR